MHILISNIQWDTDGMHPQDDCNLPEQVVMLDAPEGVPDEEAISTTLSDAYGFCHQGFNWELLSPANDTHAGGGFYPYNLGICRYPQ